MHFSEQYLTCSQFLAQDFRQTISLPQRSQSFLGRSAFLTPRKSYASGSVMVSLLLGTSIISTHVLPMASFSG